jgi:hypothetical protein
MDMIREKKLNMKKIPEPKIVGIND